MYLLLLPITIVVGWIFYQIYVFGHADQEARNFVEIVGGEWNGVVQTFNFTQMVSPDGLAVNDDVAPGGDEQIDEGIVQLDVTPQTSLRVEAGRLRLGAAFRAQAHRRATFPCGPSGTGRSVL